MKVVINRCYGGFGLSKEAEYALGKLKGVEEFSDFDYASRLEEWRTDPHLITVVEALGKRANGLHANLAVVTIPDGVEWTIEEYDGIEWVAEKHRTWR